MFQVFARVGILVGLCFLSLAIQADFTSYVFSVRTENGSFLPLLYDGEMDTLGTWSKERALLWRQSPPQSLQIELKHSERRKDAALALRLHAAYSEEYAYQLPKLLALYSLDLQGNYTYLGEWRDTDFDFEQCAQSSSLLQLAARGRNICNGWLTINFATPDSTLLLVVHSSKNLFAFDELVVSKTDLPVKTVHGKVTIDPLHHSIEKLVALENDLPPAPHQLNARESNGIEITAVNPWSESLQDPVEELTLLEGETEIVAFKLEINPKLTEKGCMTASLQPNGSLFLVNPVVAIDGKLVPDALAPIASDTCITPAAGTTIYLAGKLDATSFVAGNSLSLLKLAVEMPESEMFSVQYQLPVTKIPLRKPGSQPASKCLIANPWGYSTDIPIWNPLNTTLDLLTESGVNGFFISPASVAFDMGKNSKRRSELLQQLGQYRDRGILIIYMALELETSFLANGGAERLEKWVINIDTLMSAAGFGYDQWALYPIDEIDRTKLNEFLHIVEHIKRIKPSIRVYANPLFSRSRHRQLAPDDIIAIWRHADIVQPRLELYLQHRELFLQLAKSGPSKLWIYDNPAYPAKREDPIFYRALPILAAIEGLYGVGYWSISDTRKSSAWNDFDGFRADWSTLYESESGPIKSRRFIAFEQGLEEACLIGRGIEVSDPDVLSALRDRLGCNSTRTTAQQHICKTLESPNAR